MIIFTCMTRKTVLFSVLIVVFLFYSSNVYSEGTTITFDNLSNTGVTLTTQSWNNNTNQSTNTQTQAPALPAGIQEVKIENYPLFMSIINKYLQIYYDGLQNPQTATQIPSTITLYQSFNNSNSTSMSSRKPDPTDELIKFVHFSPLPANESLLPQAEQYVIKICLRYNNISASGCPETKTSSQASEILGAMILNKYMNEAEPRPIQIILPSAMPQDQQMKVLVKIETDAISMIESSKEMQKREADVSYDGRSARLEAESGTNWTHDLKEDRSIHIFRVGKSFTKASKFSDSNQR